MRLRPRPPSPPREPIIPLINVAFLVLVFMMLATTIEPVQPVPVELAASAADEPPAPLAVVTLDAAGRLAIDGSETGREALLDALRRRPPLQVTLRADGSASARAVIALAREISAAGVGTVELATRRR